MPNLTHWLHLDRAEDAWRRIQDKPLSIVIVRNSIEQAPQMVRLEEDNTVTEVTGAGGSIVSVQRGVVFGVRGHATIADTNIQKGDRFTANGLIWRVIHVKTLAGERQAIVEAQA